MKDDKFDAYLETPSFSSLDEVEKLIDDETITGGMIPKVTGCKEAVDNGVERVHIVDGRIVHSILLEIFTDHGIGTMFLER